MQKIQEKVTECIDFRTKMHRKLVKLTRFVYIKEQFLF